MGLSMFSTLFALTFLATFSAISAENADFVPLDIERDAEDFDSIPHIVSVERETIPVVIKNSASSQFGVTSQVGEKSLYAVQETRVGYARLVRAGVSVQIGTTATMHYKMRFRGVSSARLVQMDKRFVKTLSKKEKNTYYNKKKNYKNDLNVPYLRFLGINLSGKTSKKSMDEAAKRTKQYNKKAAAARAILKELSNTSVVVSGSITAMGVSFKPTTAFAFIESSRVKLSNGQIVTVVSSNKSAVKARTASGQDLPTTGKDVDIADDDYFFEPKA